MDRVEWGIITRPHGARGELKITPYADLLSFWKSLSSVDVAGVRYKILSVRAISGGLLLRLDGIDTIDKAEKLRDNLVTSPRSEVQLDAGHYFFGDLYGFSVFDERLHRIIGRLDRVESYPSQDVYVVSDGRTEHMIPAVKAFERGVDFNNKILYLETIEGMLDEN